MNSTQVTHVATQVQAVFARETLDGLGREAGLMKRSRVLTPWALSTAVIGIMASMDVETIADLHRGFNATHSANVTYKPFWNQLAKPAMPIFAQALFAHLLAQLAEPVLKALPNSLLERFDDILLQDGSSFALHQGLKDVFPGRFTANSPAAVELHVTYSLLSESPVAVHIAPDKQSEHDFLPKPHELKGKLLLADRGYQNIVYCHRVHQEGGHFVVRFKANLNPVILRCHFHGARRDKFEGKRLKSVMAAFTGKTVDLLVQWPECKGKPILRLVLVWNPAWAQHMVLATNLDRTEAPPHLVRTLYRLRWQIELLFRRWKSWANLHRFVTRNPHLAKALMWFALCAAFFKTFLAHTAQKNHEDVEISTHITAKAVRHFIPGIIAALHTSTRRLKAILRETLEFIANNAKRTNPVRDARYGRRQGGIQPVSDGVT